MTFHLFCLGRVAPVVHDRILTSLRTIGTPTRRTGTLTRKRGYRSPVKLKKSVVMARGARPGWSPNAVPSAAYWRALLMALWSLLNPTHPQ